MPLWRPAFPGSFPEESEAEARITSIVERSSFQLLSLRSFQTCRSTHFCLIVYNLKHSCCQNDRQFPIHFWPLVLRGGTAADKLADGWLATTGATA